jgi:hypothetical protein
MKKTSSILCLSLTLASCISTQEAFNAPQTNLPKWFYNPIFNDGVAASSCVKSNGDLAMSRSRAETRAFASLASSIGASVEKRTKDVIKASNDVESGSYTSETISHVRQLLRGAKTVEVAHGVSEGQNQLCVLVAIEKAYYENEIKKSVLEPTSKEALIAGFALAQAEQKLSK